MSQRVLVVDDDPRLSRVVAMYLTLEGFEVTTADDAEAGLAAINRGCPDLVILDIMMGSVDGIEACGRIRNNPLTAHLPVIMFSAVSSDQEVERARLAGANHLITKPYNLPGLGAVVRACLEGIQTTV
jgi:DNA-binding response OmpR family regulator